MKKRLIFSTILLALLVILMIIIICVKHVLSPPNEYPLLHDIGSVKSVEIVYYENDSECEVLKVLSLDEQSKLFNDILNLEVYEHGTVARSYFDDGYVIKITYLNGDVDLLSSWKTATKVRGYLVFTQYYFDDNAFDFMVSKYYRP